MDRNSNTEAREIVRLEDSAYWELLTEEERAFHKRFKACTTMEELRQLGEEMDQFFKDNPQPPKVIDNMTLEEFKQKYDLIDIRDLTGKYGF